MGSFFYGKNKANERSGHLTVSDHRRPRLRATPEELQMRCRSLKWRQMRFLKVSMSYRPGNTAAGRHFTVPWCVEGSSYETVQQWSATYPGGMDDI